MALGKAQGQGQGIIITQGKALRPGADNARAKGAGRPRPIGLKDLGS